MARSNLEVAHEIVDAIGQQDVTALLDLTDPEVEWHPFFSQLDGAYRGHDGIREYMADLADSLDVLQLEIEDTLSVDDLIVLLGRLRFRGKSGVEDEIRAGWVLTVRDGRALFMRVFRNPRDAFKRLADA